MWYSKVVASLNSIPDFIQHYEQELEEARREVAVYGNIEKNLAGLPGITASLQSTTRGRSGTQLS